MTTTTFEGKVGRVGRPEAGRKRGKGGEKKGKNGWKWEGREF